MPATPAIELPGSSERREVDALGISGENRACAPLDAADRPSTRPEILQLKLRSHAHGGRCRAHYKCGPPGAVSGGVAARDRFSGPEQCRKVQSAELPDRQEGLGVHQFQARLHAVDQFLSDQTGKCISSTCRDTDLPGCRWK